MVYLGILILVAAVGLLRLWLQHRREHRNRYSDIEGLRSRLERLTAHPPPPGAPAPRRDAPEPRPLRATTLQRVEPLDPARREAAKRRIEARRASRAGSAG